MTGRRVQKKTTPLYVARPLKNGAEILRWARDQGLGPNVPEDELHVTILFSQVPVDWFAMGESYSPEIRVGEGGPRSVERMGDAIVLRFMANELRWRHESMIEAGASSDHDEYRPHISVRYDAPIDLDLSDVEPFTGELVFGPEEFKELDPEWKTRVTGKENGTMSAMSKNSVNLRGSVTKVNEDQRIAYGWFSVIEEGGSPVVDHQGDVIAESTLTKAVHEFMLDSRAGKMMHKGRRVADIVESIVLTKEVQKALGVDLGKVGWFGAMKFRDDEVWAKVKSGELRAFSIGGTAGVKEL